jgi:hypothetical protein
MPNCAPDSNVELGFYHACVDDEAVAEYKSKGHRAAAVL